MHGELLNQWIQRLRRASVGIKRKWARIGGSSNARTLIITSSGCGSCSSQLKLDQSDANHVMYTDHFVYGTKRLFVILSLLFSSMVCHGCIHSDINISTLVPIPKNNRKSLNDSNNYRAIA